MNFFLFTVYIFYALFMNSLLTSQKYFYLGLSSISGVEDLATNKTDKKFWV